MKSQYRTLFAFIALLVVVSLACVGGGSTTPPTEPPVNEEPPAVEVPEQPQATEEPVAAATEPPVQSSGQEFFTEEFDGDISNWSIFKVTGSDETNEEGLTLETDSSRLVFDVGTKYLYTYLFYEPFEYSDVSVEANVENRGTNNNNTSLICRYSDEGWYEFNIANNGLYDILYGAVAPDGDISYSRLADGGSNKIKSGKDINVYKIICKGRKLSLFINGYETRVLEDNNYVLRDGKVGISVSSFKDLPVKVEYDWVTISEP